MIGRAARNLASQAVRFAVGFADRIFLIGLLVRQWGPNAYSDWALLLAGAGLLTLADPGFQLLNANRLVRARVRGDAKAYADALSFGLFFYLALALALAALAAAIIFGVDLAAALNLQEIDAAQARLVFALLAASMIARVCRGAISQIYRSRGEFARGILVDTASTGLVVAAAASAALLGAGPAEIAAVYVAGEILIGWGVSTTDIALRYRDIRLTPRWPRKGELRALAGGLHWYAAIQSVPKAWPEAPVMLLGWLGLGGVALTGFVVQRTLVNFGRSFLIMLETATGVELAQISIEGADARAARGAAALARVNAVLAGAMAAGVLLFGPAVIAVWTGRDDLADLAVLGALVAAPLLVAAATPLSMLCTFADQPRAQGIALCVQFGVGMALALAGGLAYGAAGVAAGLAAGEAIGIGLVLPLLAARSFGVDYGRLLVSCLGVSAAAAAFAAATGWAALRIVGGADALHLAGALALWGAGGLAPLVLLAMSGEVRARFAGAAVRAINHARR